MNVLSVSLITHTREASCHVIRTPKKAYREVCMPATMWVIQKQVFGGQLSRHMVTLDVGYSLAQASGRGYGLTRSLRQPHERPWAKTTQAKPLQIPDLQKLRNNKTFYFKPLNLGWFVTAVDNCDRWMPWNLSFSDVYFCYFLLATVMISMPEAMKQGKITNSGQT